MRIFKDPKTLISNCYVFLILILPIASQFTLWGYSSFGIIELVCIVVPLFFISFYRQSLRKGPFFLYYCYCIISILISSFVYNDNVLNSVLSIARVILLYITFFSISLDLFEFYKSFDIYKKIVLIACIGIWIQVILFYLFNIQIYFIPKNITLNYGGGLDSNLLIAGLNNSVAGGYIFRPSSFFIEPSFFSYYALPCLALTLQHKKGNVKKQLIYSLFISISIFLTTSTTGIVTVIILWIVYFINTFKKLSKTQFLNILLLFALVFILVVVATSQGPIAELLHRKWNQLFSVNKSTVFNSTSLRLLRGFGFYSNMDYVSKLIGCGFTHIRDYYFLANMHLAGDYIGLQVDYMNSFGALLCSLGIVGSMLYWTQFYKLMKKIGKSMKELFIVLIVLIMTSSFIDSTFYFLIIAFILSFLQKEKKNEYSCIK